VLCTFILILVYVILLQENCVLISVRKCEGIGSVVDNDEDVYWAQVRSKK